MSKLLELHDISKRYPGVRALDGVDFDLNVGEVHILLGENGAGKSTLVKIISGATKPDSGVIKLDGEEQVIHDPAHARALGIATIYQEFNLVPELTVGQNIYLGREPHYSGLLKGFIDWKYLYADSKKLIESLGIQIDPKVPIAKLGVAQRQMVEIARALSESSRILILDEPTASLTDKEIDILFEIIEKLKKQGVGTIYISHRLAEVHQIGDRLTVLRDGQLVAVKNVADTTMAEIIPMMIGRRLENQYPHDFGKAGEEVLRVTGAGDVPLVVRRGEVVGLAGMVGAGRTELAEALFGLRTIENLQIQWHGNAVLLNDPAVAKHLGIALLPEDRRQQGLATQLSISENIAHPSLNRLFPSGVVHPKIEVSLAKEYVEKLNISTPSTQVATSTLSGGNQQKVVLAKWLATEADLLIFDEPTRGVDVGSKAEIHSFMNDLAKNSSAILMISSDLPEILGMSDRVYVMRDQRVVAEIDRAEATQSNILAYAIGEEH